MSERAKKLADNMSKDPCLGSTATDCTGTNAVPTTGASGNNVCYEWSAGTKMKMSETQLPYFMFSFVPKWTSTTMSSKFSDVMGHGQHTALYLVEQGMDVVDADGKVNVTAQFFPALGAITEAGITVDFIKDTTTTGGRTPDTAFHPIYHVRATTVSDKATHYYKNGASEFTEQQFDMIAVFNIKSFVSNKITIRDITFGEVWGQIGGAWGGAALVMALFFTASGSIRSSDSKELMVFRWYSTANKKAAIAKAGGQQKMSAEEKLLKRVEELEAWKKSMSGV